jgi:hypothetical protein
MSRIRLRTGDALRSTRPFHSIQMSFRLTSAWASLLALAAGLAISLIVQTGRSSSEDRNRDGRADVWQFYDRDGGLVRVLRDRNFDGYVDTREVIDDNRVISRTLDQNFDHRFDPGFTEQVAAEPDDTCSVTVQPFLLPRAARVGDHPIECRSPVAGDPASKHHAVASLSGRAPPATL